MSKRLPVLVEQTLQEASVSRMELTQEFLRQAYAEPGRVSCRKGCSNCCYHPVMMSVLEGITLFRWLQDNGMWTRALKAQLQDAQSRTWGLSIEVWALSAQPCPFLQDSQCSIYEGRPMACRVTLSKGDPYACHPHRMSLGSGILPKRMTLEENARREALLLKRHGLKFARVPLASAILVGEKVVKGEVEVEDAYIALLDQQG